MNRYSVHGDAMIARADLVAWTAHAAIGQKRKYTGENYINHPREVAGLIQAIPGHTWQQVVWALIHDVVEDTHITLGEIEGMFSTEIRDGLWFLTNVEKSAGNRAHRHYLNCERLRQAPKDVATVKVMDIRSNTQNIVALDPVFAPQYLREKADAMNNLTQADPIAWRLTWEQIQNAALSIGASA